MRAGTNSDVERHGISSDKKSSGTVIIAPRRTMRRKEIWTMVARIRPVTQRDFLLRGSTAESKWRDRMPPMYLGNYI